MPERQPYETREEIVTYLEELNADGRRYVKAHEIADELGVTNQTVGRNLGILRTHDVVDVWGSEDSNTVTYRIQVDNHD